MKLYLIFAAAAHLMFPCFLQSMELPQYSPLLRMLVQIAHDEACMLIQQSDININEADHQGVSLLMLCCAAGLENMVQSILVRPDVLINAQDNNKYTALMHASYAGKLEIIKMLLAHPKINILLKDYNGRTALYWAK